jgi:hypothetical protein
MLPVCETRKQMPRHGEGAFIAGTVQGMPSGIPIGFGAFIEHDPVRGLQRWPVLQCSSDEQNGKHPGASGIAFMCVYQKPVHT